MPSPNSGGHRDAWLQVLRAFAAFFVVLFHAVPLFDVVPSLIGLKYLTTYGFVGVDLFFVLSGYVVTRSIQDAPTNLSVGLAFMLRRFVRIFLGYWPAMLLTVGVFWWVTGTFNAAGLSIWTNLFLLSPVDHDYWIHTSWSLCYELGFYTLLFVLIFLVSWRSLGDRILLLGVALLIYNWTWLLWAPDQVYLGQQPLRHLLSAMTLEFLAGAWIACHGHAIKSLRPLHWVGIAAVSGIAFVCAVIEAPSTANISLLRAATFGVFSVGVLLLCLGLQQSRLRAPPFLVVVGDASFALYLLHPLVLAMVSWSQKYWALQYPTWMPIVFGMAPIIAVLASCVWYFLIERPLHRGADARVRQLFGSSQPSGS